MIWNWNKNDLFQSKFCFEFHIEIYYFQNFSFTNEETTKIKYQLNWNMVCVYVVLLFDVITTVCLFSLLKLSVNMFHVICFTLLHSVQGSIWSDFFNELTKRGGNLQYEFSNNGE